jgi:hypothetical protein
VLWKIEQHEPYLKPSQVLWKIEQHNPIKRAGLVQSGHHYDLIEM